MSQELGNKLSEAVNKAADKTVSVENYELSHSNTNQQFHGEKFEEIAYDLVEMKSAYHRIDKSYNEEQRKYAEQAFNDYGSSGVEPSTPPTAPSSAPETTGLLPDYSFTASDEPEEGISLGIAETPKLLKNTLAIQDNQNLQKKLDGRRKQVQRGYTRFSLQVGEKELHTKAKLQFRYYGKFKLSEDEVELGRVGRLRYTGIVVRDKMDKTDYEDKLRKKEKKSAKRAVKGRLLFRTGKQVLDNETIAEDDDIATAKRTVKRSVRATKRSVKKNVKTLRLQNNTYARLQLAEKHEQVLKDKRERLISDSKRKMERQHLKDAQSRAQKKKLKKQMVQRRAREEGNFFRRTMQNRMVKRKAKEYRRKVAKRIITTICSSSMVLLIFLIILVIIFLVILALVQGGSTYAGAAITQNDYGTITDTTAYFRKLETDLDEYLNADREALEAELEAEYGPDIYEYVYNLADFGFSNNTLIAYLSAMYGTFTLADVQEELDSIFEEMYTLTIEVKVEDREIDKYNPETGEYEKVTEPKNICYVTLEKKELEEIVEERLPENLEFQYTGYKLSTGGQQVYGPVMRENWTNLISSNFGERIHPITKERKPHNGVDIAVPTGTKIYSAIEGTVTLAQYSETAGNWLKIQNEEGWTVVMMHMDSLAVSAGQKVEKGDFVGYSGNTGRSTGPHLHLEVRNPSDEAINPIFIIPQTCAAVKETEE